MGPYFFLALGPGLCGGLRGCNEVALILLVLAVLLFSRAGRLMVAATARRHFQRRGKVQPWD